MVSLQVVLFCVTSVYAVYGAHDYAVYIEMMSGDGLWNLPHGYHLVNVTVYQQEAIPFQMGGGLYGFNFMINGKICEVKVQQDLRMTGFLMAFPNPIPKNIVVEDACGIHDASHQEVIGGFFLNLVH